MRTLICPLGASTEVKQDVCAGFGRPSHHSVVVLFRQHRDGHRDGLCKKCADKFNGSNENWPPERSG